MLAFLMVVLNVNEECRDVQDKKSESLSTSNPTYCFKGSGFISITGENIITQVKGTSRGDSDFTTMSTIPNKAKVISIQEDNTLSTIINCTSASGCTYNVQSISPSSNNAHDRGNNFNYSLKSLIATEPVNAYIYTEVKNDTFKEKTAITYILDQEQEYSIIPPNVPCVTPDESETGNSSFIQFQFEGDRIDLKKKFKQISFTKNTEGKIREIPIEDGLKDLDSLKEYKDTTDYSKPYSCDPYNPYGKPYNIKFFTKIFGECNEIVQPGHSMVYLQKLKALPGKGFCLQIPSFIVNSKQKYHAEFQNYSFADKDIIPIGERYTIQKPYLVSLKNNVVTKLTCDDTVECEFQFSNVLRMFTDEDMQIDQNIQVALNKGIESHGILSYENDRKYNLSAITFLTDKEFDIKVTSKSGNISVSFDLGWRTEETITVGNSKTYKKSQGAIILKNAVNEESDSRNLRKILENNDQKLTAEYSLTMTINNDVKTSDEKPFNGDVFSGEVKDANSNPTSNNTTPEAQTGDKLTPGAIAGIVIAVIAVIAIICVLVWFFVFHKKPSKEGSGSGQDV